MCTIKFIDYLGNSVSSGYDIFYTFRTTYVMYKYMTKTVFIKDI